MSPNVILSPKSLLPESTKDSKKASDVMEDLSKLLSNISVQSQMKKQVDKRAASKRGYQRQK